MRRVLVIPDSFKGTLTSKQVGIIIAEEIKRNFKDIEIEKFPISDGGEGCVECFVDYFNGKKMKSIVYGPFDEKVEAVWGIVEENTAVIEIASCAGHIEEKNINTPLDSSTFGVGELILEAVNLGCKRIMVCLGGACTNDGGCGLASALGVKFLDSNGKEFVPTGRTLKNIERIDKSNFLVKDKDIEIITLVDVKNPLYGSQGAAYVFAPQKGADMETVKKLDEGLRHLNEVIKSDLDCDVCNILGAGASGGTGAGMRAFLNSKIYLGIEYIGRLFDLENKIKRSDVVITGEGKVDNQSLNGKVLSGIIRHAKKYNIPVIVITGGNAIDNQNLYELGINSIFSINLLPENINYSYDYNKRKLQIVIKNMCRLLNLRGE